MTEQNRPPGPEMQRELDSIYAVQMDDVTKDFGGGVRGLDDVTVGFRTGKITVLLGLSGSGKSTLLRHINGLATPTSGNIRVLGRDLTDLTQPQLRDLRREVGVIFQDFNLVGPMSVLENVCTGRLGSLRGPRLSLMMYPKSVRREALEKLDRVGLADRAFQRADTLSGGQQQRVAIARALMQNPRILLADEPVASLDPVSAQEVMNLLLQISAEDNLTVISSLHQVQLAIDFAERIIGLRSGRIVLDENTASLTAEEASRIYSSVAAADTGEPASAALVSVEERHP
ncbi:phosphonate ABC transporter ATP-binding protein [Corynebacterium guangdongense]|uniref:Phosphonate transport system ATP-binding protein n=1 Tax=Corynebacterium guangdongense TaxID=1783348 RepID=A0ABU2A028_9CORY|nr:phosphonate ABC transporter ATP-binding protein [Corynebacterium guangdongense]MDR7329998.1 phosphonate transport system ATP-binding protein [Corynebacterium guangdongense]WJZ18556.1 Phosphate-import ATP-binding protein PhnC [Corynebacterium guangdongense]